MKRITPKIIHSLIIYHFLQTLANRIAYQQCLQFVVSIHLLQEWDKNSRLKSLVDDKNHVTSYTYDALNRRKKEILPDLRYKEFFYDASDNIYRIIDANGSQIDQTFDDINRLTARSISRGTGVTGVTSETYGYDGLSRMTSADNDYSSIDMTYDTMSRLLTEQQQIGGGSVKSVQSVYDNVGFRTQVTYPGSKVVNFVPDALDRINQIKDASNNVIAQYTYAGTYRVTQRDYLNNTKLTMGYDANRRITNYESRTTTNTLITGFAYAYDNEDNKLFEKRTHDSNKGDAFRYDSIYRLTGVKYGVPNLNPAIPYENYTSYDSKEEFGLDGVGNRQTVTDGVITTTYLTNILNQYYQISSTNLTYDYNGNLKDDGTNLYSYDYANRLMEVKRKSDNVTIVSFQYDALGRRILKYNNLTLITTNYYYDGARVIEERNGSDTVIKTYTHGNGIDELLTMETATNTYYFHENSLGSIYAVTDNSGVVVERYKYEIYGRCTFLDANGQPISQSAIGNNYLFTGRELDTETGLYYFRARYYSAELGRFINRDPMADDSLLNLYTYGNNSPLNFTDPFGLSIKQPNAGMTIAVPWKPNAPEKPRTWENDKADEILYLVTKVYLDSGCPVEALDDYIKLAEELRSKESGKTEEDVNAYLVFLTGMAGIDYSTDIPRGPEETIAVPLRDLGKNRPLTEMEVCGELLLLVGKENLYAWIGGGVGWVGGKAFGYVGRKFISPTIGRLWSRLKGAEKFAEVGSTVGAMGRRTKSFKDAANCLKMSEEEIGRRVEKLKSTANIGRIDKVEIDTVNGEVFISGTNESIGRLPDVNIK